MCRIRHGLCCAHTRPDFNIIFDLKFWSTSFRAGNFEFVYTNFYFNFTKIIFNIFEFAAAVLVAPNSNSLHSMKSGKFKNIENNFDEVDIQISIDKFEISRPKTGRQKF